MKIHRYTHIELFLLFQLIYTNFRVLISYLMLVYVHHVTVLCNNIPMVLRNCIPKSKVDALK